MAVAGTPPPPMSIRTPSGFRRVPPPPKKELVNYTLCDLLANGFLRHLLHFCRTKVNCKMCEHGIIDTRFHLSLCMVIQVHLACGLCCYDSLKRVHVDFGCGSAMSWTGCERGTMCDQIAQDLLLVSALIDLVRALWFSHNFSDSARIATHTLALPSVRTYWDCYFRGPPVGFMVFSYCMTQWEYVDLLCASCVKTKNSYFLYHCNYNFCLAFDIVN
eukprot:5386843-Amphidinium_carterae.2